MKPKAIVGLLKETFQEWQEDKAPRLAAALAYYTVFSLAPLLIIAIAVAGAVFGEDAAQGEIVGQIQGLVGREGAKVIEDAIENANKPESGGGIASLISIVVLLFGASGVFAQLQDALNTVWEVQPKPGRGIWSFIRQRFLSFSMVLGIGFLLMVSLIVSAVLSGLSTYMSHLIPGVDFIWEILNFVISFGVITLLFALIYKYLPDVKITWNDVLIGAVITALLFTIGKTVLGQYLGGGSFGSAYGAAGSLVIILAWVFYSAQILFFGAEFTQVYARRYGSQIVPDDHAESVTEEARAKQGMPRRRRR
ncbi:MAG TPA: YihY/virulence factor BrkB family protein [Thermosynechococcaceae cyanobacterium]